MKFLIAVTFTAVLLIPAVSWAAPKVNMTITAEKDIVIVENGQQATKRVTATEITPGEVLIYTISYENVGDETATNVAIVDPIPEGSSYIKGSATETGELNFSIDGGKTYNKPSLLTDEAKDASNNIATPDMYTHVRWMIPAIAAGEKGSLTFQVLMK